VSTTTWLDDNNRYLAASLEWLRLKLLALVPSDAATPKPATPVVVKRRSWFGIASAPDSLGAEGASPPGRRLPAAKDPALLASAADKRETAAKVDPQPALLLLARRLELSAFERDTLLLCAAADLDPGLGSLLAHTEGNAARAYPTFSLALQLFDDPTWDALSPHRPLRYARLIEINQPGATPLTASALRADERIVNYLKGLNVLDERLASFMTPIGENDASELASSQQLVADVVLQQLRAAAAGSGVPTVRLVGTDTGSKYALAQRLCASINRRLYRISIDALPTQRAEIENLARLWQRESMLLAVALYVDAENLDGSGPEVAAALHWLLSREVGLVFVGMREAPPGDSASSSVIEVKKPTVIEQHEAWKLALQSGGTDEDAERAAQRFAGQFNLSLQDIRLATQMAARESATEPLTARAWNACLRLTQPKLDALAQRLEPKATWEDLVLSDESTTLLRQIVGQVRERYRVYEDWGYSRKMTRGLGINALFSGESGTGKTMAAEVLANELRLALYRIDLSAVVSKYIGQTEKNLRQLFDAAERGGAILFFDEADALFGKRSEVRDSHDRYANIEINYLLQRMESFSGLAILATNMKSALDNAFMRRLRFIVTFQFPGLSERKQIWQKALPADVPREALDFERLARFSLSGGNIHSIALNAAFAAAERGSPVTLPLMLSATRSELRKIEKPLNEAEFR
jgi:AAA+ superfamily predicted ATPase